MCDVYIYIHTGRGRGRQKEDGVRVEVGWILRCVLLPMIPKDPKILADSIKVSPTHSMYGMYEPAGEGEEGAHNVTITEHMTREDVLKRVMAVIESV